MIMNVQLDKTNEVKSEIKMIAGHAQHIRQHQLQDRCVLKGGDP